MSAITANYEECPAKSRGKRARAFMLNPSSFTVPQIVVPVKGKPLPMTHEPGGGGAIESAALGRSGVMTSPQ